MSASVPDKKANVATNPYQPWAARFWQGMLFSTWVRLVFRNRVRISPRRWGLAFTCSTISIFNSVCHAIQQLIYARRIARTEIRHAPIFIVGHWRSGTTLLHELLVLDEQHTSPTTFECFVPNHFLVTGWFLPRLKFLLPAQRPMDNMEAGWDRPQEDEFALCNLGVPSPYATMAFPNNKPQFTEYLDFQGVSKPAVDRWKASFLNFLKLVTFKRPKRIVLKSPPHTGRIGVLAEMFPEARFVHIVRDPIAVFPSTVKLWKTLYMFQGLQVPTHAGLDEYVFHCFERMYDAFEAQRPLLAPERFFEVRYEDLVQDPLGQVEAIYQHFGLGGFAGMRAKLETYRRDHRDYQTNRFQLDPQVREAVYRRWGPYMQKYGYCQESVSSNS